jgi:hypothetical protein
MEKVAQRTYECKQEKNGEICGISDPEKFVKGRYTMCIDCKNEYHKKYHKKVLASKEVEMNMTIVEKINENRGDLGKNVHDMVVDIYQTYPLEGVGIAIPGKLKEFEDDIIDFKMNILNLISKMDKKIENLVKENETVKEEKENLKKNNTDLKNQLDTLNEKYFNLLVKNGLDY